MDRLDIKILQDRWREIFDNETLDYENPMKVERIESAFLEAGCLRCVLIVLFFCFSFMGQVWFWVRMMFLYMDTGFLAFKYYS